jgi:hypothetical protein
MWRYHSKYVEQFPDEINCVTLHLVRYILEYVIYDFNPIERFIRSRKRPIPKWNVCEEAKQQTEASVHGLRAERSH